VRPSSEFVKSRRQLMATAATITPSSVTASTPSQALADLNDARRRTLELVAPLSDEDLTRVHSPIMSPLVWDLGHIAAYEDLWLAHRHGGLELLRPDLADVYDAFETPRAVRGEIEALGVADARAYLQQVCERSAEAVRVRGVGDGVICELVLRHELQHSETMRQTLAIAGLLSSEDRAKIGRLPPPAADGQAWVSVPAGPFSIGAGPDGFAYDNERPRRTLRLDAFQIARTPVSTGAWMRFAQEGGYDRREPWSAEGWAWRQEQEEPLHPAVARAHPDEPVCHVSWFEADAYARAQGARLPSEAEWERAGGERGALEARGSVWEWTESHFGGYPGFVAHPYREYSEVFFGERYRVLRGGSWATHPRVASLTFRNWDLPLRRQIFAGLRLARDA
jgi:gamma-glutamyl hercynylcysteine S-oxide synthase